MKRFNYKFHFLISKSGTKHLAGELDGITFSFPDALDRSNAISRIIQNTSCTYQDAEDCYDQYVYEKDRIPITAFANYADYLADPHWAKTRRKAMARAGFMCEQCGSRKDLNVHHLTYRNIGQEYGDDLVCLCRTCHSAIHGLAEAGT